MMRRDPMQVVADDFRTVADDTYDWESWLSPERQLLWVNPAVERITGATPRECYAMPDYPLGLVVAEDRAAMAQVLQSAFEGRSGNDQEFRVLRKDGSLRWVAMSWQASHNRSGEWLGVRLSVRDIHGRKQLELELAEALKRAREADQSKADFLALMSHELRTPLHCIAGYAELMQQAREVETKLRWAEVVAEQSQELLELLDSILDLSVTERHEARVPLSVVDVAELVRRESSLVAGRALLKKLSLQVDIAAGAHPPVRANLGALQHVLRNLLSNAVKFTQQGGIVVRVESTQERGQCGILIEVQDTGPGLPEGEVERLFQPFERAGVRGSQRGTGLGLAIAERFSRALGGTLRYRAGTPAGAVFTLRFSAEQAVPQVVSSHPAAETAPLRVLVADDSEPSRVLLRERLQAEGAVVTCAEGGATALALLRAESFGLALLDLDMPDLSGDQVARLLRECASDHGVYLVAQTANRLAPQDHRHLEVGFDEVVVKPLSGDGLRGLLGRAAAHAARCQPADEASADKGATAPTAFEPLLAPQVIAELRACPAPDGGNLFLRIAAQVLAEQERLLAALAMDVASGDRTAIMKVAHQLAGNCALVGGREAAARCNALLEAAERGDEHREWEATRSALRAFADALQAACQSSVSGATV